MTGRNSSGDLVRNFTERREERRGRRGERREERGEERGEEREGNSVDYSTLACQIGSVDYRGRGREREGAGFVSYYVLMSKNLPNI